MNATVTARVPVEVKMQVDRRLRAMGSSATELINAAYDYVLNEGSLPLPSQKSAAPTGSAHVKSLSAAEAKEFKKTWARRCVLKAPGYDGYNFKEMLNAARDEYYAGLS